MFAICKYVYIHVDIFTSSSRKQNRTNNKYLRNIIPSFYKLQRHFKWLLLILNKKLTNEYPIYLLNMYDVFLANENKI